MELTLVLALPGFPRGWNSHQSQEAAEQAVCPTVPPTSAGSQYLVPELSRVNKLGGNW